MIQHLMSFLNSMMSAISSYYAKKYVDGNIREGRYLFHLQFKKVSPVIIKKKKKSF